MMPSIRGSVLRTGLGARVYRTYRGLCAEKNVGNTAREHPGYVIGPHTYGKIRVFHDAGQHTLTIGDYCSLGEGSTFWVGGGHRTDWVTTYPFNTLDSRFSEIEGHPVSRGNIEVGSDVWVGFEALIMSGVTIGHGAVIGARSVVTKDVEPYAVVAGSPARVVRRRFDEGTVSRLLDIAWWEWDEAAVHAAVPFLQNADVTAFFEGVDSGSLGPSRVSPA